MGYHANPCLDSMNPPKRKRKRTCMELELGEDWELPAQDKKGWLSYWFYSLRTLVSQEFSFSSSIPDVYKELHGTAC